MPTFRFRHTAPVRFSDIDVLGHVNHLAYLDLLESARIHYYYRVLGFESVHAVRFVLVELRVRYLASAHFGQSLEIGVRIAWLKRSSSGFAFEIRDQASGQLLAEGDGVQVYTDLGSNRAEPLPTVFRERILAFEGDGVEVLV